MRLKDVFTVVLESADNLGPHQLSAMYLTFLRIPSKKHAILLAENIIAMAVEDLDQEEYSTYIGRRVENARRNIEDEAYFYQDDLREFEWFFREAYGNHSYAGSGIHSINLASVFNAFVYYLAVME